jgi:hypothetical protein
VACCRDVHLRPLAERWLAQNRVFVQGRFFLAFRFNAKNAFTSSSRGHRAAMQTFRLLISSSSFSPGWLPQYSLYLIMTAPELAGVFPV